MPSSNFIKDEENKNNILISEDEYIKRYKNGKIPEETVSHYIYKEIKKEEEDKIREEEIKQKEKVEEMNRIKKEKEESIAKNLIIQKEKILRKQKLIEEKKAQFNKV